MTSPLKRVTDILDVRNFKRVKLMKQNVSVLFLKICFFEKFFLFSELKHLSKLFIQSASVLILKNYFFEKNGISSKKDTIQANTGLTVHFNNNKVIIAFYSLKRA